MQIVQVHPATARSVFQFAAEAIAKAAAPTPETPASLLALVEDRAADLWVVGDDAQVLGVAFTQVLIRPKDKVYNILAVGGSQGWKWMKAMRARLREDAIARGAEKAIMVRQTGKKSYFGSVPAGYYYEDVLNVG